MLCVRFDDCTHACADFDSPRSLLTVESTAAGHNFDSTGVRLLSEWSLRSQWRNSGRWSSSCSHASRWPIFFI